MCIFAKELYIMAICISLSGQLLASLIIHIYLYRIEWFDVYLLRLQYCGFWFHWEVFLHYLWGWSRSCISSVFIVVSHMTYLYSSLIVFFWWSFLVLLTTFGSFLFINWENLTCSAPLYSSLLLFFQYTATNEAVVPFTIKSQHPT